MPLKDHVHGIPGGWQFSQPETGWESSQHCPHCNWKQLRDAIIKMRLANPRFKLSTNPEFVEHEMDVFNSKRLEAMPGTARFLLPNAAPPIPPSFPRPQRRAVDVVGGSIKNAAVGIGVIVEMFGPSAEPVVPELSEKRARICAGDSDATKCPKNERGNLLQRFTAEAMVGIQKTLSIVKDMDLKTSVDSRLGTCSACECPMRFKVHVPLDFILQRTTPETMGKLDDRCWVLKRDNV